MLRTRLRLDSSMADSQEFEGLVDAAGGARRGNAALERLVNVDGRKLVDRHKIAEAFEPGVVGVDRLFVLVRHRHHEQRFGKVAGFADHLVPGGGQDGPRRGQIGSELLVAGLLVLDVGGGRPVEAVGDEARGHGAGDFGHAAAKLTATVDEHVIAWCGFELGDVVAEQGVDAAEVTAGRARVKHGHDAFAWSADPMPHELAGQPAVGPERERKAAAERLAKAMLVVDADAGDFERDGGQRGERLEIGNEQVGLFHQRELADQIERLASGTKELAQVAERAQRGNAAAGGLAPTETFDAIRSMAAVGEQAIGVGESEERDQVPQPMESLDQREGPAAMAQSFAADAVKDFHCVGPLESIQCPGDGCGAVSGNCLSPTLSQGFRSAVVPPLLLIVGI